MKASALLRRHVPHVEILEARIAPAAFHWNVDASGSWTDQNNWFNESTNQAADGFPNAANDVAKFLSVITASRTVSIPTNVTVTAGSLLFSDDNNYTISGGLNSVLSLDISSGQALILTGSTGSYTISESLRLNDPLLILENGSGTVAIDGVISEAGGAQTIDKAGPGTLIFTTSGFATENNTYTGTTTVSEGALTLNKRGIAIPGPLIIGDGSGVDTVQYLRSNQIVDTSTVTVNRSGVLALGASTDLLGTLTLQTGATSAAQVTSTTGTLLLTDDIVVTQNGTGAVGAVISAKVGLGATRTFNVPNGSAAVDLEISGVISGAGAGLTASGAGTMRLSGAAANTYDGLTTASGSGVLELGKTAGVAAAAGAFLVTGVLRHVAADQILDTQTVTVGIAADSGSLLLNGFNETVASLTIDSGSNVTTGAGTLTLTGDLTVPAVANLALINGLLALPAGTHTFTVGNGAGATELQINAVVSGAGAITKTGAGTLDFDGALANSYAGTTTILDGTMNLVRDIGVLVVPGAIVVGDGTGAAGSAKLSVGATGAFSPSAPITVKNEGLLEFTPSQNFPIGALTLETGTSSAAQVTTTTNSALTLGGDVTVNSTGTGATGVAIALPLNLGGATRIFTVADGTATNDLTISQVISGGAGSGLTKAGAGTLRLNGTLSNSYSGNTTVNDGNLFLEGGNFNIPGGTLTIGDGTGAGNTARVTLNAVTTISNGVALVIKTDGTLVMGTRNATITTLTMDSGTNDGGAISGTGGTLTTTGDVTFNVSGTGAAEAVITANLTLGGNVTVNAAATSGTVVIAGALGLGGVTRTFSIADGGAAADLELQGVVSGGITKTGAGTLRLSGAQGNSSLNPMTVADGGLQLAKSGVVAAVTNLVVGDGAGAAGSARVTLFANNGVNGAITVKSEGLLDLAGFNLTAGTPVTLESGTTSGAQITTGAGTLTLNTNLALNVSGTGATGAVITGNLANNGGGIFTIADGAAAVDLDLAAAISGNSAFTKAGPGAVRFSGTAANTYSAGTNLNDGTLILAKPTGVAAFSGPVNVGDGTGATNSARLVLGASNQIADTTDLVLAPDAQLDLGAFDETLKSLTMQSGTTAGARLNSTTGRLTLTDTNSLTFNVTGTGATAAAISANVTLGGGVTLNPSATSATVTIAGQLDLGASPRTFLVNDGAASAPDLDISAVIAGGAAATLFKPGTGTLRLSGTQANTFTGLLEVDAGLVELAKSANTAASAGPFNVLSTLRLLAAGQIPDTQPVSLRGIGSLDLNGFNETLGGLNLITAAAGTPSVATGSATLTLGGNVNVSTEVANPATATLSGKLDLGGAARTFTIAAGGGAGPDLEISAVISGGAGSALILNGNIGGGNTVSRLRFSGAAANTYAGATTILGGKLELNKTGVVAVPGAIILGNGVLVGGAVDGFNNDAILQPLAAGQFANGTALTVKSDGRLDLNGFNFTSGTLSLESGSASGARIQTGAGTLTLGGDLAFSVAGTGTIEATITGNLNLGAANRTFAIADGASANDLIIGAVISGPAGIGFTKTGAGTLTLLNPTANTYTGTTSVTNGELLLGGVLSVPGVLTIGDSIGASGSARVSGANPTTLPAGFALNVKSDGLITFNNAFTVGPITLESGTAAGAQIASNGSPLTLGGDVTVTSAGTGATGAVISMPLNLGSADRTFSIANGDAAIDLAITGGIAGGAGIDLTKTGAGTLQFTSGIVAHQGATNIADGTLLLDSALTNSSLTVGDGTGATASAIVRTIGNNRLNSAALTVKTDGLLDLNDTLQPAGLLTLETGTTSAAQISIGAGTLNLVDNVVLAVTGTGATGASIAGNVSFASVSHTFTIADGTAAVDLDFTATIADGANNTLTKAGAGALRLGGTGVNALLNITVNDGRIILNKPVGGTAFTSLLTIGDGIGAAGSARVVSAADQQIPDTANVVIKSEGLLDFAGATETLGGLIEMQSGTTFGAQLATGAGKLVIVPGFILIHTVNGTGAGGASLTGTVDLNGNAVQFSVGDGAAAVDLNIGATLIGGAGSSLAVNSNGAGVIRLSGAAANTYAGATTIVRGTLELGKTAGVAAVPGALDIGTVASGTVRLAASNQIPDSSAISLARESTLDLNGFDETVGPLTLDTGHITTGAGTLTLAANLTGTGSGISTVAGNLSLGASTRTFSTNNSNAVLVVYPGITGGAGAGIVVTGNGLTRFAGGASNVYTGTTTVLDAQFELSKGGGAIAIPGALVIGDGDNANVAFVTATLPNQLAAASAVTVRTDGVFNANGSQNVGTFTLENGDTGSASLGGSFVLGGDLTVVKVGAGSSGVGLGAQFELAAGNHTFTVPDGTASDDLILFGSLSGVGSFTKTGAGTLVLNSGSNSFTGSATIAQGTMRLADGSQLSAANAVVIGESGTLGIPSGNNVTIGPLTLETGAASAAALDLGLNSLLTVSGDVTLTKTAGATATAFTFNVPEVTAVDLVGVVSGPAGFGVTKAGAGALSFDGATSNTFTGAATVLEGRLTLGKTGGARAIPGVLVIGDGIGVFSSATVTTTAANQIASGGAVTVRTDGVLDASLSQTLSSLTLENGDTSTGFVSGDIVLAGDLSVVNVGGGGNGAFITGTLDLAAGNHTFTIADGTALPDLDITADITGVGSFTKAGAGTLRLSSNNGNTFTGSVAIAEGVLDLSNGLQLSDLNAVSIFEHGTLSLPGGTVTIGPLTLETGVTGAASIDLGGSSILNVNGAVTLTKTAGATATAFTFDVPSFTDIEIFGAISGPAGFGVNKTGGGSLGFKGGTANTYSGTTTVLDGTLTLGKTGGARAVLGALVIGDNVGSSGSAVVVGDQPDQLEPADAVTVRSEGQLNATTQQSLGSLTLENADTASALAFGNLVLSGDVTTVNLGTGASGFQLGANLALTAGNHTITVADGTALEDFTLAGILSGTGDLTKAGPGALRLDNPAGNTFTGATTVAEGRLILQQQGIAIRGALFVGDGIGAGQSAVVQLAANGQFNPNDTPITVRTDGRLDIVASTTINNLTLESGTISGGQITGSSLDLAGAVALVVTGTGAIPATIAAPLFLSGTPVFTIADGAAAADLDITATVDGASGLRKEGPGTLRLGASASYNGATAVNAGTLLVDGVVTSSAITLANGARLGGGGTVDTVTFAASGGKLAPGDSPGIFTTQQSFALNASSTLEIEINGTNAGTDFDVLTVGNGAGGALTLGNAALALQPGFVPTPGQIFKIVENNTVTPIAGTFAGLPEGATVQTAAGNYAISYVGGNGNDVILTPQFITPTVAATKTSATFKDVDGDLVTVSVTKGKLATGQFLIIAAGSAGGGQLARLDLSIPADLFATASLTISAAKKPGGDGLVNVGAIDAHGVNLGTVTVKGDLGQIDAGNGSATIAAIASLLPNSLGVKGLTTQAGGGSLTSDLVGKLGALKTIGAIKDAVVNVTGAIGPVTIGGSLAGGRVQATAAIGNVAITGSVTSTLGAAAGSGSLIAGGAIGTVTIKGDLANEAGSGAGKISAGGKLGAVSVTGFAKGADLQATGDIAGITIGKDFTANASGFTSRILGGGRLAALTVKGSILGGAIRIADDLGALAVSKDIIGTAAAPVLISAEGKLVPTGTSDLAIGKLTVNGDFTNVRVFAGYDTAGNATNADASIGPVLIGKNWAASSMIAGTRNLGADQLPGGSGANADNVNFGDGNDFLIPLSDNAAQTAKIASIIIKGTADGSAASGDHFGIVAQEVGSLKIGATIFALKKTVKENLPLGATGDFRLREI